MIYAIAVALSNLAEKNVDYKITVAADNCDTLIVEGCDITLHNTWGCVACTEVGHIEIRRE